MKWSDFNSNASSHLILILNMFSTLAAWEWMHLYVFFHHLKHVKSAFLVWRKISTYQKGNNLNITSKNPGNQRMKTSFTSPSSVGNKLKRERLALMIPSTMSDKTLKRSVSQSFITVAYNKKLALSVNRSLHFLPRLSQATTACVRECVCVCVRAREMKK